MEHITITFEAIIIKFFIGTIDNIIHAFSVCICTANTSI